MCKEHEDYYLAQEQNEKQRLERLSRAQEEVEKDSHNVAKLYNLANALGEKLLYEEQLEIFRRIHAIAPLAPHDPDHVIIRNGTPLERNAQLNIAKTLTKIVVRENAVTIERMSAIVSEYLKAMEFQPARAEDIYMRIAGCYELCQSRRDAVLYYRKIKLTNDISFMSVFAKCLVELATEEAAAKQLLPYQINALYHEALPLLRRALVDDMDNDKNLELKEYLARALDGVNEREEATAIRNKIERVRQRKEEERRRSELIKRPPPLPEEFQSKFEKLYIEEQQILDCRFGLKAGGSLISVETTARERGQSEEFIRHVEEIALQKLGVDVDYMKSLRAEYRRERYEEEKARRPKGMFIPSPDEERTIDFRPRAK